VESLLLRHSEQRRTECFKIDRMHGRKWNLLKVVGVMVQNSLQGQSLSRMTKPIEPANPQFSLVMKWHLRKTIFKVRSLTGTDSNGSNGLLTSPSKTMAKSHEGILTLMDGRNRLAPRMKRVIKGCFPTEAQSIREWQAEMAATKKCIHQFSSPHCSGRLIKA